jgi:hypothetical protein
MKTMKFNLSKFAICTLFISALSIQACNDDSDKDISEDEQMSIAENSTESDSGVDEDLQAASEATGSSSGGRIAENSCAVVTRDATAKTITIDFGTGCQGRFGRSRTGKIIITYGGEFNDSLANRTITFQNYTVGQKHISGTIELRNFNLNGDGHLTCERKITDYTVTYPNGKTFTLNGTTTREWLSGDRDKIPGNEVIKITGSYTGESTNGRKYSRTIVDPIIANFTCKASGGFLRVSGSEEMTMTTAKKNRTRTINYGTGDCDNEITITVNGTTKTVSITD